MSDNEKIAEMQKKAQEDYEYYKKTLHFMGADVPIGVLCLPDKINNILIKNDVLRVYDLCHYDFRSFKGIGEKAVGLITSRLNDFLSVEI